MSDIVQTVTARLEADIASWQRGMRQAEAAVDQAAAAAERASARTTRAQAQQATGAEQAATRTSRAQQRQARQAERTAAQEARAQQQARAAANATAARATAAAQQIIDAHTRTGAAAGRSASAQVAAGRTASQIARETATATAEAATRAAAANRALAATAGGIMAMPGRAASAVGSGLSSAWTAVSSAASRASSAVATATRSILTSRASEAASATATAATATRAAATQATASAAAATAATASASTQVGSAASIAAAINALAGTSTRSAAIQTMSAAEISAAIAGLSTTTASSAGRVATAYAAIVARAQAMASGVVGAMRTATAATAAFAGRLTTLSAGQLAGMGALSSSVGKVGAVMLGTSGLAAAAAIQWESAWTGVTKTVDGTPEELKKVEMGLRDLAKVTPISHTELAEVAENAGQLGVATKDVVGFTKTMVDLGVSTNLTADEAATSIAQISNIMGTMARDGSEGVSRFGATLVALGNDGASTEKDILNMAQRMAGAVKTLGGSESDLLALSNTLASMGIRAELGGGVATRVLLKMSSAVDEGGEKLTAFAKISGVSADEFSAKFKSAPIEALDLVARGLAKVTAEGGNVTAALADMGMKGTEEKQVMLALAQSGDLLMDSLKLGGKAWRENAALAEEANKRYATASSQIKTAWNRIKDAGIDAGAAILPMVSEVVKGIANLVTGFQSLPGGVKTGISIFGLVGGAALLAAAGMGKMVVGANNIRTAINGLKGSPGVLKGIGIAGGIAGAALSVAAVGLTVWATNAANARARTEEFKATMDSMGGATEDTKRLISDKLSTSHNGITDWLGGVSGESPVSLAKDLGIATEHLSGYIMGNADSLDIVNQKWDENAASYDNAGGKIKNLRNWLDEIKDGLDSGQRAALENAASLDAQGLAAEGAAGSVGKSADAFQAEQESAQEAAESLQAATDATNAANAAMGNLSFEADGAARSLAKVYDEYTKLTDAMLQKQANEDAFKAQIRALEKAAKAEKKGTTNDTDAGQANRERMRQLAADAAATASAMETVGQKQKRIQEARDKVIEFYKAMDTAGGSAKQAQARAEAYADSLNLIPDQVYVAFDSNAPDMEGTLTEIFNMVRNSPDGTITINENAPEVIEALELMGYKVKQIDGERIEITATDKGSAAEVSRELDKPGAKKREAKIIAKAVDDATTALNRIAHDREVRIKARVVEQVYSASGPSGVAGSKNARGARLPARAGGGKLPRTGLGTDQILGVSPTTGRPTAWVDDEEWVVNARSSEKYNGLLSLINRDAPSVQGLAALASGGRVGWSVKDQGKSKAGAAKATSKRKTAAAKVRAEQKDVNSAQKAYDKIDSTKKNRSKKAAAKANLSKQKAQLKAAEKKLAAAEKAEQKAKDAYQADRERTTRLRELTFDTKRDLYRGSIQDNYGAGNYAGVDALFEASNNPDLSKRQRASLRTLAYAQEKQTKHLTAKQGMLEKQLDAAQSKADELKGVRDGVRDSVKGTMDFGSLIGQKDAWGYDKPVTKTSVLSYAKGIAAGAKTLSGKLTQLRKLGFPQTMLQQVIDEWTGSQTFELANALLAMNTSERGQLTSALSSTEKYGLAAGQTLTETMYSGGYNAAQGLVKGLESQISAVEREFTKMATRGEKAFKKALGIKSPSRVMAANAGWTVKGYTGQLKKEQGTVAASMASLATAGLSAFDAVPAPQYRLPASTEVQAHALRAGTSAYVQPIDYDRLAEAISRIQVQSAPVAIGDREVVRLGQEIARVTPRLR